MEELMAQVRSLIADRSERDEVYAILEKVDKKTISWVKLK